MSSDSAPDAHPLADQEDESGEATEREASMATRGWVLVAVTLASFLLVPATILFRPPNLPFEVAFLVLPLLPAFLLGATAVWALAGRD